MRHHAAGWCVESAVTPDLHISTRSARSCEPLYGLDSSVNKNANHTEWRALLYTRVAQHTCGWTVVGTVAQPPVGLDVCSKYATA